MIDTVRLLKIHVITVVFF